MLLELVRDDDARWRPWIKACAIHAASLMAPADLDLLAEVAEASTPMDRPRGRPCSTRPSPAYRARQLDLV